MDLILTAAIYLTDLKPVQMSQIMSCPSAQEVIGRLYADKDIPASQKEELMEVILEHAPINCQVPQAV